MCCHFPDSKYQINKTSVELSYLLFNFRYALLSVWSTAARIAQKRHKSKIYQKLVMQLFFGFKCILPHNVELYD